MLSINNRAHLSVNPSHDKELPGLSVETSPMATAAPVIPSMMEYPNNCVPSCMELAERW